MNNPELIQAEFDPLNALLDSLKDFHGHVRLSDPKDVAMRYVGLRQIEKLAGELKEGMQQEVRGFLDDGELLEVGGQYITYQASTARQSCDWRSLVKDHPELESTVQRYIKTTGVKPSVVVRVKEDGE